MTSDNGRKKPKKNIFPMSDLLTIAKGLELTTVYAPISPDERKMYMEIVERIRRKPKEQHKNDAKPGSVVEFS